MINQEIEKIKKGNLVKGLVFLERLEEKLKEDVQEVHALTEKYKQCLQEEDVEKAWEVFEHIKTKTLAVENLRFDASSIGAEFYYLKNPLDDPKTP